MTTTSTENTDIDVPPLQLYIRYESHLRANQIGRLLLEADRLYGLLRTESAPSFLREVGFRGPERLLVSRVETGNSIIIEIVQGVDRVLASSDPVLTGIVAGGPALIALSSLFIRVARRALELREAYRVGNHDQVMRELEQRERYAQVQVREFNYEREVWRQAVADLQAILSGRVPEDRAQESTSVADQHVNRADEPDSATAESERTAIASIAELITIATDENIEEFDVIGNLTVAIDESPTDSTAE